MTPYYDRDGITIYCGNCLVVMPGIDGPFDAIIADLPYGTTDCSWDVVIPLNALWIGYKRLIKDRGAVVLFGSQPFTSALITSNLKGFKYCWTWDKKQVGNPLNAKKQPLRITEDICIFNGNIYIPQMKKGKARWKGGNNKVSEIHGHVVMDARVFNGDYYPTSIIEIPNCANKIDRVHPTQKPVALLSYLIRTYTNPGEVILDNTMGSGTTLVAAQREGRRAVGIETSEDYCKIAVERLRQPSFFSIPNQTNGAVKSEQLPLTLAEI